MEDCVINLMDRVLNNLGACKCDNCTHDILAIALNALPSKYVVTQKGEFYTKVSTLMHQFDVDIISALTKASVIVSRNPRHER